MANKDKELQILKAYYDKKHKNIEIDATSFNLESSNEGGFYLANLERDGYLMFEWTVLHTGGMRDEKYNNAVAAIWWSDAHITRDGEQHLRENNQI